MWNQPEIKINLLLIRHGKTPSNREHRYLGVTEEALSGEGRKQLEILAEKDILKKPWLLFISPMLRCQESAGILFPGKKAYPIEEWREMNFGAYEGKNYEDLKNDAYYQKWIDSNGTLPFPEGESQQEYIKRCKRGLHAATKIIEGKITGEIADAAMPLSKSRITELREPEKQTVENQMTENPITESQPRNVTASGAGQCFIHCDAAYYAAGSYLHQSGEKTLSERKEINEEKSKLQFFHVEDLCRFIDILVERHPKQHIFNVGNKESISIRDWVTLCYQAAGKQAEFVEVTAEEEKYFGM